MTGVRWLGVAIALFGLGWLSIRSDVSKDSSVRPNRQSVVDRGLSDAKFDAAPRRNLDRGQGVIPSASQEIPGSLRDTEIDGALPVDDDGNLIVGPDILRFLEYFFIASGETSDAAIRNRIDAEIDARLEEPALSQARDLMARFLEYRRAAARLHADGSGSASLADRLGALSALREDIFGTADAAKLFGVEARQAAVAVEMRRLVSDPTLSPEERERLIAEVEAELPEEVREVQRQARAPLELSRDEAALRAAGGTDQEVRSLREERFGVAAAERLANLDQRRSEWRSRVDEFRRRRSVVESTSGLSSEEKAARVEALLESEFSANERKRVSALDRIELAR